MPLGEALQAQRGHLIGWCPVALALGVGAYFLLPVEPGARAWLIIACSGLAAAAISLRATGERPALALPARALMLVAAGLCLAGGRAQVVAEPVLSFRYYGPVEGRIVKIDRSASDAVRLTLDRVVLGDVSRPPTRVRVSLHGRQGWIVPEPGQVVILTGHLSPPGGPVEPGGFDFRRMAWFDGLGAVGYTRTPVLLLSPPEGGRVLWLPRARMALARAVEARIPGEPGAFAAAISTGDRSAMGAETLEALRATNLAHLLAISGLHMGLLTGFLFGLVRYGLALVPAFALRFDTKKIGAVVALAGGAAYLALSGGNVATERAFVMVAVMLVAVLAGRRALTLRAVAIAALVVLLRRPEELLGPGFQMSFAATTALVAVFGWMRRIERPRLPRLLRPVAAVAISSLVAGLATAPFGAAHFNQVAHFGLLANLLSVPVMGLVVMPAAVIAACLVPFGLAAPALWVMGKGLAWILWVAGTIAEWEGATGHVVAPGPWVLPLLSFGALVIVLWKGRTRWVGALPMLAAFVLWAMTERPALLIAETGGLIGILGGEGRALSSERGNGFAAGVWLENDGQGLDQRAAYNLETVRKGRRVAVGDLRVLHVTGKRALSAVTGCGGADLLVTNVADPVEGRPCLVLDAPRLRRTGAVAGHLGPEGLSLVGASSLAGQRPWSPTAGTGDLPERLAPSASRVTARGAARP